MLSTYVLFSVALAILFILAIFLLMQLRQAQARLHDQAQEIQDAKRQESLGTMAGGIAHDFNNILGSILGFGVLLEEDLISQPELQAMAKQITTAARRGQEIVAQLMNYSRRTMSGDAPVRQLESIDSIVRENIALLNPCIRSSTRVSYENNADGDMVMSDATQIGQVIVNLCINADHAIGVKAGAIDITLDNIKTASPTGAESPRITGGKGDPVKIVNGKIPAGTYARISIRDNGNGMTREVAERIFDPFFTTKEVNAGTGLGLAAVQGIVHAHGGAVHVTTTQFKGTTFEIFLPMASTS